MRETTDKTGKKTNYLNRLAQNLVNRADDGDVMAMKEVGDRLDGRPAQAIEATGNLNVIIAASDKSFT
jgi:ribosomal protein L18E